MAHLKRIFPAILVAGATAGTSAQGVEVSELDLEAWCRARLGASMAAMGSELVSKPQILEEELTLAFGVAEIATEVSPDSEAAWRRLYELSTVLSRDVPGASEARRRAIEAILRLDPDDAVMRLRLLLDRIESRPTAAARIEAYQRLLAPENIDKLGKPAAARIAFDLALLEMRVGDQETAASNVLFALQLDPSFPRAADMAAGLFRATVGNPIDEAELLAIAFTASPLDGVVARALGHLVLRAGDYQNAAEIVELALALTPPDAAFLPVLVSDEALALWGSGRAEEAILFLERADRERTIRLKQAMIQDGDDPFDVEDLTIPPSPEAALIEAVIIARSGTRIDRDGAVETLFRAFEFEASQLNEAVTDVESNPDASAESIEEIKAEVEASRARLILDEAWARAWFGWTPDVNSGRLSLEELLQEAETRGALAEGQREIIHGWWAIHEEEYAQARTLLETAAERSPYALAGLALLEEVEGQTQQAARRYLEVYRDRPGDVIGLWSRSRLSTLLGVEVPTTEEAKLMFEMLRSTLPKGVGRAIRDPKHGVLSVRVEPRTLRFSPFQPVTLDISLTNVSEIPLAIGPDGPIQPSISMVFDTMNLAGVMDGRPVDAPLSRPAPIVLGIDRSFSIAPQQSISISVDLTSTPVARQLNVASVVGGNIQVRAIANSIIAPGKSVDAGLFGREAFSPVFRVDGLVPETVDRTEQMLSRMANASTVSDVKDVACLLSLVLANSRTLPLDPSRGQLLLVDSADARASVFDAFLALPPIARAWVLSTLQPGVSGINTLIDRVVTDETDFGMAICLARFSPTPASLPIVEGLVSADPRIRRMAEAARDLALVAEERESRAYRLDDTK